MGVGKRMAWVQGRDRGGGVGDGHALLPGGASRRGRSQGLDHEADRGPRPRREHKPQSNISTFFFCSMSTFSSVVFLFSGGDSGTL